MIKEGVVNLKKQIILIVVALSLFTGCSNSIDNSKEKEEDKIITNNTQEKVEIITVFNALGKTYESTKDISKFNEGDEIYSNREGMPYIAGEYKEVDFATDLVTNYLAKNKDIYNYLVSDWDTDSKDVEIINGEEKSRVEDEIDILSQQLEISKEAPIYFNLDKVILNEKLEDDHAATLEIRGHISKTNGNFRAIGNFFVTVYTKGDKLYASII